MEATALFDFEATTPDELGITANSFLLILKSSDESPEWVDAEQNGKTGLVPINFLKIEPTPWYHPSLTRVQSQIILLRKDSKTTRPVYEDGTFLLRNSESTVNKFSLSVKYGARVLHFKIFRDDDGKFYIWTPRFDSVNKLIVYYKTVSLYDNEIILLLNSYTTQKAKSAAVSAAQPKGASNARTTEQKVTNEEAKSATVAAPNENAAVKSQTKKASAPSKSTTEVKTQPGPQTKAGLQVRAMFDFVSDDADLLPFKRGDIIDVLEHDDTDESSGSWWKGRVHGNIGLFPSNYVRKVN